MVIKLRNRIITAVLVVALILGSGMGSGGQAFADDGAGSFLLFAATDEEVLIGPAEVSYSARQTIRQALEGSGYSFESHGAFIDVIEGVAGSYEMRYDGGGFDLDKPASGVTAFIISENSDLSDSHLKLLKSIYSYSKRTDNVHNSPGAEEAYAKGVEALMKGSSEEAETILKKLDDAISYYDNVVNSDKYTVSIAAKQNGTAVSDPKITLIDEFGNVTEFSGLSANVHSGNYSLVVSDGKWNRVETSLEVKGKTPKSVDLPYGEWFGDISLLDQQTGEAYPGNQNSSTHKLVWNVPDFAGEKNPNLKAMQGSVPDTSKTKLYAVYEGINGKDYSSTSKAWSSEKASLTSLIEPGMKGRNLTLEARYEVRSGEYQIQSYDVDLRRSPTLLSLKAYDGVTELSLRDSEGNAVKFDSVVREYEVWLTGDSLKLVAEAFGDDYQINGTGTFSIKDGDTRVITVSSSGESRTYTLKIHKAEPVTVRISSAAGTDVKVYNQSDSEVPSSDGSFSLIEGEQYYYVATRDEYYHTRETFTAESGLEIKAVEPETLDLLSDLALYNASSQSSRKRYTPEEAFSSADHSLTFAVPDAASTLYVQADTAESYTVTADYLNQTEKKSTYGNKSSAKISNSVGESAATVLKNCLAASGYGQNIDLVISREREGVTIFQNYEILLKRTVHLRGLSLFDGDTELTLMKDGKKTSFDRDDTDYSLFVDRGTETISLSGEFINEKNTSPACGGYFAAVNDARYDSISDVSVKLDPKKDSEEVHVEVGHADSQAVNTVYTFRVDKVDAVDIHFETEPANASIFVKDNSTGKRLEAIDKVFSMIPGRSYTYTVTAVGYKGVKVSDYQPGSESTVDCSLVKVPVNTSLKNVDSYWSSTRFDENNNACVDTKIPKTAEEASLYWATKVGDGYSSNACGCPIIADGYLYTYAGNKIHKIDTISGEIVKSGTMDHASSFAINNPTYAAGMIFVGLSDGTIQAFDASTLESLWIYHDELKGQPDCPIVYHEGFIYTGFWNGEAANANFVCLSATDEDPSQTKEEKLASWTYTAKGGFYWAGAYVGDDYLLVGGDDGVVGYTTGHADMLSLDPASGRVIDKLEMTHPGDVRSGVTFEPDGAGGGTGYFTSKGGDLYKVTVDSSGKFNEGSLKSLKLPNFNSDAANPGMSTSTPAVYNGRAYVGVSGISQFGQYSGHNISVIDLKGWKVAYSVRTQGYPQSSGLITTAYKSETGTVNVYFFDNYTPGKLRMITDKPGQTSPSPVTVESYTSGGTTTKYDTGYVLFTPFADQAQYCICSPITDEYGTMYFKNDSAYMMAVGSAITKLEVTNAPDKTEYKVGETFDPKGMKVEAVYANGMKRDVTDYVKWSEKALTDKDDQFEIDFPYVLYHDENGAAGTKIQEPFTTIKLTILTEGDTGEGNEGGDPGDPGTGTGSDPGSESGGGSGDQSGPDTETGGNPGDPGTGTGSDPGSESGGGEQSTPGGKGGTEPVNPSGPSTQTEPSTPTEPSSPTNPSTPSGPSTPAEPSNQEGSSATTESSTPGKPSTSKDPASQVGSDGTALGNGASKAAAEKAITSTKGDKDLKGSVFNKLRVRQSKVTKTSITIKWNKVSGAKKYMIFAGKSGKKNRMKKITTLKSTKTKYTLKKFNKKKLVKGTYYKFAVVALNSKGKVITSSRFAHVATLGKKKASNPAKVTVNSKVKKNKITLKVKKSFKLKGSYTSSAKKYKIKKILSMRYESTKPAVATVSSKGVIKAKKKGTCYVYVFAQNGLYKRIKVTVKK